MNSTDLNQFDTITPPISADNRDQWQAIINGSGYFFSRKAMRFFASRVAWASLTQTPNKWLFITSEQHQSPFGPLAWDGQRRYTLRAWDEFGGLREISDFGQYATMAEATRDLKHLAKIYEEINAE